MDHLAHYIIRASFSQERMRYLEQEGKVIYTAKDDRTNENFPALGWLTSMCSHILWQNILDTQVCVSYTSPNKKQVLINQFNQYGMSMKSLLILPVTLISLYCIALASAAPGPVSDEARRHFDRGLAAVEMATTPEEYGEAFKEFKQAARLAPDWAEPYYNLGLLQEKTGQYGAALESFRKYLLLAPTSSDIEEVKSHVNKLEYRKEKFEAKDAILKSIAGKWVGFRGPNTWRWWIEFIVEGDDVYLYGPMTGVVARGGNHETDYKKVRVTVQGKRISFKVRHAINVVDARHRDTFDLVFDLELVDDGKLRGKSIETKSSGTDDAYFIKDRDGSLRRLDENSLRRLLYNR